LELSSESFSPLIGWNSASLGLVGFLAYTRSMHYLAYPITSLLCFDPKAFISKVFVYIQKLDILYAISFSLNDSVGNSDIDMELVAINKRLVDTITAMVEK
jgi:hypothetical protein